MEGVWETARGAPLLLFAIPDDAAQSNRFEMADAEAREPDPHARCRRRDQGPERVSTAHPPVLPVFLRFRIMVGIGMLMLLVSWIGLWRHRRDGWHSPRMPRALLWLFAAMTFSGWVATVAGWYVTEIGRQPFIVYGLIRTADVASRVPSSIVALTLGDLHCGLSGADRGLRRRAEVHGREGGEDRGRKCRRTLQTAARQYQRQGEFA